LNLTENGIGRARGKISSAADHSPEARGLETILQLGQTLAILGEEGYGNAMHGAVLADFSRCLHVRKTEYPSPSDPSNRLKA
jgi:ABC-type microcin C transport system duplicated ATPase subunit YejF